MAIYDENGEPMGFVGGGPFISGLNELLEGPEIPVITIKATNIFITVILSERSSVSLSCMVNKLMESAEKMFSNITQKTEETETDINLSMGYLNNFSHINDNVTRIQSIARQKR